ncbi:DUF2269 domain-containing protein [Kribbella sp. NPDC050124]|uniref:DUF2269 domain-containing protein n=1 Tax=Kribbella sp. NPDC050124 TaxID=3364114 RepID=UPI003789FE32
MPPSVRKFVLTTHVTSSVGWLGGVATVLALAVIALTSNDATVVRACYISMEMIGWWILVPLSVVSLISGVVQALGSAWGLLRHYWVLVKFVMNVAATGVLLLYMQTLGYLAALGRDSSLSAVELLSTRDPSPVVHGVAAVALLLVAVVLSVYKPRGVTRFAVRRRSPA